MRRRVLAVLLLFPAWASAGPADVAAIKAYVAESSRLEAESQSMHSAMIHAMFGYIASNSQTDLSNFSADYEQDDGILRRLSSIQAPKLSNHAAQVDMLRSVADDRAWGKNARRELHQLLQIGKSLTTSEYLSITKQEDAHGTELSNLSDAYTLAALKVEGLTVQQSEAVMLQAEAEGQ